MSDFAQLAEQLRLKAQDWEGPYKTVCVASADAIERLTKELSEAKDDYLRRHNDAVDRLEEVIALRTKLSAAEAARDEARAALEKMREDAARIPSLWSLTGNLLLHCGEMTQAEMRTAKAVLRGVSSEISALPLHNWSSPAKEREA